MPGCFFRLFPFDFGEGGVLLLFQFRGRFGSMFQQQFFLGGVMAVPGVVQHGNRSPMYGIDVGSLFQIKLTCSVLPRQMVFLSAVSSLTDRLQCGSVGFSSCWAWGVRMTVKAYGVNSSGSGARRFSATARTSRLTFSASRSSESTLSTGRRPAGCPFCPAIRRRNPPEDDCGRHLGVVLTGRACIYPL